MRLYGTVRKCPVSVRTVRSQIGHFGHCSALNCPICVRYCPIMSGAVSDQCPIQCPIMSEKACPVVSDMSGTVRWNVRNVRSGLSAYHGICVYNQSDNLRMDPSENGKSAKQDQSCKSALLITTFCISCMWDMGHESRPPHPHSLKAHKACTRWCEI